MGRSLVLKWRPMGCQSGAKSRFGRHLGSPWEVFGAKIEGSGSRIWVPFWRYSVGWGSVPNLKSQIHKQKKNCIPSCLWLGSFYNFAGRVHAFLILLQFWCSLLGHGGGDAEGKWIIVYINKSFNVGFHVVPNNQCDHVCVDVYVRKNVTPE